MSGWKISRFVAWLHLVAGLMQAAAGQWATAIACLGACAGWYVAADEERKNSTKV